jgi:U3 small nucleolar RNA-associated protein 15
MASTLNVNSKPFQTAVSLQTNRPTGRSVTRDLGGNIGDASEARYWAEKFGLGDVKLYANNRNAKFAHPRSVVLNVGSAAVVHQIVIGSTAVAQDYRKAKQNLLAAVCGPRVPLYGTTPQSAIHRALAQHSLQRHTATPTIDADRNVPTGGQLAISAALRADGRLLAIGTEVGNLRIADTTTRATLAQFQAPSRLPLRSVRWFRDGQHVLCAGDDGVVRVWQLKGQQLGDATKPLIECKGHGDAIRCAVLWQKRLVNEAERLWPHHAIAATGSYDHSIRLWDMEGIQDNDPKQAQTQHGDRCLSVLQHDAPVEAVEWIRSTDPKVPIWLVSAGGTKLKVWNPILGTCVCTLQAQHRKSITSILSMPRQDHESNSKAMRLITAGLDGLMRIHAHDPSNGQIYFLHGIDMKDVVITSLAATFTGDRIAIGTAAGTVLVRQMGPAIQQRKRTGEPTAGTFAFFTRGMNADAVTGDYIVGGGAAGEAASKKRKLSKFDAALKQFRYSDALDEALETRMPQAVAAVLEELGKRRGLTIALSNRDEESLEPILAFTVRYVSRPRFSSLLVGVAHKLIDIYAEVAGQSETIDELFAKLKGQVSEELRTQKTLFRLVGQLDAIIAKAEFEEIQY